MERINQRKIKKEHSKFEQEQINEWDEEFEFIAGYTSNGVPYGIRKEEIFGEKSHDALPNLTALSSSQPVSIWKHIEADW